MRRFKARRRIESELGRIARDRRSGASELAARMAHLFAAAGPAPGVGAAAYLRAVEALGNRAARVRPAMPPIGNVARHIVAQVLAARGSFEDPDTAYRAVRDAASAVSQALERIPGQVATTLRDRFPSIRKPLVISYSSQVITAIEGLRGRRLRVTVCESRPALEGRRTAKLLSKTASVIVITDAQAGRAARDCDCVLLGCDAILADGTVINKSGSSLLALAARHEKKPVIVLGNRYKLSDEKALGAVPEERHPAAQIWRNAPDGIRIENVVFERVPAEYIDRIVLESGVYRPVAVGKVLGTFHAGRRTGR